jgi:5-methylthioadenosine/S-adenosylhomocysteine deaminase
MSDERKPRMEPETIVIEHGMVIPEPGSGVLIDDGTVVIEGGRITAVGAEAAVPPGAARIDAAGCAVLPGLVSCHAHSRPFRGLGDGLGMMAWHDTFVHQFSARMTPEDAYFGAANTFMEMLRNGITTVQVMTSITVVEDTEVAAAVDTGIRARLIPHVVHRPEIETTVARIEAEQAAGADRVRTWLGLEVPEIAEPETMALVAAESERLDVRVHTHFSEIERSDLDRLDEAGLVNGRLNLAHCVHVSDADIARLAAAGVSVSHNPRSNSRYGNGVAPLRRMLDAGVVVGLGTDGPDSTFSCDIFEEARLAAFLARATARDPLALSAGRALELATTGGARALGLDGEIGRLRPGAKADVIVVDLRSAAAAPVLADGRHGNVVPVLAFGAVGRDVRDVVADGRLVLRDRDFTTLREADVVAQCERRAKRILATM